MHVVVSLLYRGGRRDLDPLGALSQSVAASLTPPSVFERLKKEMRHTPRFLAYIRILFCPCDSQKLRHHWPVQIRIVKNNPWTTIIVTKQHIGGQSHDECGTEKKVFELSR